MSKKVLESEFKEQIDKLILESDLSYQEIVVMLRKRGFRISKTTIANYAKELKDKLAASNDIDIDSILSEVKSKEVDFKSDLEQGKKIVNEILNDALKSAYQLTKYAKEHNKPLPVSHYKSITEIQKMLKLQDYLIKLNKTKGFSSWD